MCMSTITMIAESAMMVGSTVVGGMQAKQEAYAAARMAEYNSKLAFNEAYQVSREGERERREKGFRDAQMKGRMIARGSAGGLDVWGKDASMQDILSDAAYFNAYNMAEMHNDNMENVHEYSMQAQRYTSQAKAFRKAGKDALTSSLLMAGTGEIGRDIFDLTSNWQEAMSMTVSPFQTRKGFTRGGSMDSPAASAANSRNIFDIGLDQMGKAGLRSFSGNGMEGLFSGLFGGQSGGNSGMVAKGKKGAKTGMYGNTGGDDLLSGFSNLFGSGDFGGMFTQIAGFFK